MPHKLPTPCSQPGCPALCHTRYCEKHGGDTRSFREADRFRGSASKRGYDTAWKKVRDAYFRAHPLCERCGAPAVDVDHIVEIDKAPERRLDPSNLQSLCRACHNRKTFAEQQR